MRVLGIDVSRGTLDVALLHGSKVVKKQVQNSETGLAKLVDWLAERAEGPVHACMEATSSYWEACALALRAAGHTVSVVNPKFIHNFGKVLNVRNKTDKADAELIARYCEKMTPAEWQAPPAENVHLYKLMRRRDSYVRTRTQELNRRKVGSLEADERELLDEHLTFLEKAIAKTEQRIKAVIKASEPLRRSIALLRTIPGVGEKTAWTMLGTLPSMERFDSAKQVAAYCGVTPREYSSGSSVRGQTRMCKTGARRPRVAAYMASLTAVRTSPEFKQFRKRLLARGKAKKAALGAVMRKLIHIIYGVLKHQRPYDPALAFGPARA